MLILSVIFTLRVVNTARIFTKCKFSEQNLTNEISLANLKKLSYMLCEFIDVLFLFAITDV